MAATGVTPASFSACTAAASKVVAEMLDWAVATPLW